MSLEAINKPRIVWRKDTSILINWENVFPPIVDNDTATKGNSTASANTSKLSSAVDDRIYDLRMQNNFDEWRVVYWGRKLESVIANLQPCTCYDFKIKLITSTRNNTATAESHWLEFKAGTNTEQFHVHHLTRAIKYAKIPLIRKIIASRPYLLETANIEDKTPLMEATECADLHVITFLCNLGAKINAQSMVTQRSPLMIALFYSFIDIAKYLIEKNANINLKDINDRTALHYAIDGNHLESVRFALNNGAHINCRDNKGWTPLLRAVILEVQDDIIKLLITKGSDPSAVDRRGMDFKKHLELTNRSQLLNFTYLNSKQ